MRETRELPAVELRASVREFFADDVSERKIHVVAAEQDVIADCCSLQIHVAVAFRDRDRRKVTGAAADVDDEHHVARPELTPKAVTARGQPRVERGLRFLEQGDALETDGFRRLHGELARSRIERRRDREDHFFRAEQHALARTKRFGEMVEVAKGCFHGRNFLDVFRGVQRQQRLATIRAHVGKPALGARDGTSRRFGGARACVVSDRGFRRTPRQRELAFALVRKIQE